MSGFTLVLSCLVVLCITLPQTSADGSTTSEVLRNDFKEFIDLLPMFRIKALVAKHLIFDSEFRSVVSYAKGDEFKKAYTEIIASAEFHNLAKYLQDGGLDIVHALNSVGISDFKLEEIEVKAPRSLNSFLNDVLYYLPTADLEALYKKKMETSLEFKQLYARVATKEFNDLVVAVEKFPQTMTLLKKLKEKKVEIEKYQKFLEDRFSWKLESVN